MVQAAEPSTAQPSRGSTDQASATAALGDRWLRRLRLADPAAGLRLFTAAVEAIDPALVQDLGAAVGPIVQLWRHLGQPDLEAFVGRVSRGAVGPRGPEQMAARDLRGDGLPGVDRSRSPATLLERTRWAERAVQAELWAASRAESPPGRAEVTPIPSWSGMGLPNATALSLSRRWTVRGLLELEGRELKAALSAGELRDWRAACQRLGLHPGQERADVAALRAWEAALGAAVRAGLHEADWPSRPAGVDASAAADLLDRVRARSSRPMALERPVHVSPALWGRALQRLRGELGAHDVETWLRPLHLDEEGRLLAPDAHHQRWVTTNYGAALVAAVEAVRCTP